MNEKCFLLPTLLVIRLKRTFSKDPVNYKSLRKEGVRNPAVGALKVEQFKLAQTGIIALRTKKPANRLVIFCHGGAFVYGPVQYDWDAAKKIAKGTGSSVWMVDYPKAPEHKIDLSLKI